MGLTNRMPLPLHTVLIWDPDAVVPSYVHMLVVNIPGPHIKEGTTVLPYTPPAPPPGTGTHRYFTAYFKQTGPIHVPPFPRANFSLESFTKKYKLTQVRREMVPINSKNNTLQ